MLTKVMIYSSKRKQYAIDHSKVSTRFQASKLIIATRFFSLFFFSLSEPLYWARLTRVLERSLHQKLRKRGPRFTGLSQIRWKLVLRKFSRDNMNKDSNRHRTTIRALCIEYPVATIVDHLSQKNKNRLVWSFWKGRSLNSVIITDSNKGMLIPINTSEIIGTQRVHGFTAICLQKISFPSFL